MAIGIRILVEPVNQSGALRELVKDFAGALLLIFLDEADRVECQVVVTRRLQGPGVVERVPSEEPRELRPASETIKGKERGASASAGMSSSSESLRSATQGRAYESGVEWFPA